MFIKSLSLKNFRNYSACTFEFINGVNILYGDNGQGKTNVLEALFLSSMGKSFRTAHDTEMIRETAPMLEILVSAAEGDSETEIKLTYDRNKQKAIRLNGVYLHKMGDLMGALPCIIFSPANMALLSAGPSERRKFTDMALCQLKPVYYYDLQQYNKVLIQKNTFLRDAKSASLDMDMLDIWNLSLAQYGAKIVQRRIEYLEKVSEYAARYHQKISGNSEKIQLRYVSSGSRDPEEFYRQLKEVAFREVERKMSLIGPQKDDIDFMLTGVGDMKKYGSQGQKRTCVLALKLAETDILRDETGKTPVLLLDDVMSELDQQRQELLIRNIEDNQIFITCTEAEKLKKDPKRLRKEFLIQKGSIVI